MHCICQAKSNPWFAWRKSIRKMHCSSPDEAGQGQEGVKMALAVSSKPGAG